MDHSDHVALLKGGARAKGGVWADMGAGSGAFTLALADILQGSGEIIAVDRDSSSLRRLGKSFKGRYQYQNILTLVGDFTQPLDLPELEGVIMANSLHFYKNKMPILDLMKSYLAPGGSLIMVEYDTDRGNQWVPFPISYNTWVSLAAQVELHSTQLLDSRPSRFLGRIYSALSLTAE